LFLTTENKITRISSTLVGKGNYSGRRLHFGELFVVNSKIN